MIAGAKASPDGSAFVDTNFPRPGHMTQQNVALVSAAAAESLKDQAQRLSSVVQVFRLNA
jgi:methyl-accepting chemotaxis protein